MRICYLDAKQSLGTFPHRHFADDIIILCVRCDLRFSLSYRDLDKLMAGRNLSVDHTTVWRWVQRYAPELDRRVRRELKRTGTSWRVDEPNIRVAGRWMYFYRAVDSNGAALDFYLSENRDATAAKQFPARSWLRRIILARASGWRPSEPLNLTSAQMCLLAPVCNTSVSFADVLNAVFFRSTGLRSRLPGSKDKIATCKSSNVRQRRLINGAVWSKLFRRIGIRALAGECSPRQVPGSGLREARRRPR